MAWKSTITPEVPSLRDVEQDEWSFEDPDAWNPSRNLSEKTWSHGWGIDGYPYLAPQSHFLVSRTEDNISRGARSGRPPPWAPHYPYPEALVEPSAEKSSASSDAKGRTVKDLNGSVDSWIEESVVRPADEPKLPEDVLAVLDEVARSFNAGDREGFMAALDSLHKLQGTLGSEKDFQVRSGQLLEAYAGRAPLQSQAGKTRLEILEKELVRRMSRVVSRDPEAAKRFVEEFPEPLRSIIEPCRMAREASAIAPPSRTGGGTARTESKPNFKWKKSPPLPGYPPYQLVESTEQPQRAVSTANVNDRAPRLSQAVLQLPWSSEQKWERRWEQDLVWHPGILYAAHQAPPHVR